MLDTLHQQLQALLVKFGLDAELSDLDVSLDLNFTVERQLTSLDDLLVDAEAQVELAETLDDLPDEHHATVQDLKTVEFNS